MKKVLILTAVIGALLAASFYFLQDNDKDTLAINDQGFIINKYNTPAGEVANEVNWTRPKKNNKDERGIKHAAKYLNMLRSNPDGEYNPMDYYRARVALNNKNNSTAKKAAALGLEWELLGPNNIAGRNRGFLIDKDNPNKLYTGGVTGGMFVSEDLGESWYPHPQTSEWDFLGISSIQQAPNGDIYFGTGEYFVFTTGNASGHLGGGIYKSTDGGETFEVLPSTIPNPNDDNDTWSYVTEIAIDPSNSNKIYATTATGARNTASLGGGLQISNDGGQTWNTPTISSTHENREALEVAVNSNGVVFLCQNRRYFRSVNGTEFDLMSGQGGFPEFGVERIEFAVSPTDPNYVYALISNGSSALRGIYKSTDAGLTWETISPENSETFNPLGSQGFYDMCIAVSPQDKERVFIGGQVEFYAGQAGGWNLIASSFGGGTSPYYIHADMHGIHPHPNNPDLVFIISDGGTFKTKNASNQFPTFEDANKLCHTTQFYTVQADDLGRSIGGTQDNGVQLIDGQRNSTATSNDLPGFGDGGYSAISEINRNAMFGQSQFGQLRRSSNGGESFGGFYDEKVDAVNNNNTSDPTPDGQPDVGTEFIAMGHLWEDNIEDVNFEIDNPSTPWVDTFVTVSEKKSIFFIGANGRLFFTPEAIEFSIQPRWFEIRTNGTVTAIESTPEGVIFAGTRSGDLYKVEGFSQKYKFETLLVERLAQINFNGKDTTVPVIDKTIRLVPDYPENNIDDWNWNSVNLESYKGITRELIDNGLPSRYISGIGVDPNFTSTGQVVVTFPGYNQNSYVYRSSGSTTNFSFTDITNDLTPAPVYDAVIDAGNSDNIILATDLGIFTSDDAGASWTEENNGIYRTPVFKLFQNKLYEKGCNVIYAGSYGRGIFRTTSLTPSGCDIDPYKNLNVSVEEPINIANEKSSELKFYPNPANNNLTVEIMNNKFDKNAVLSVIDISGKVMMQERLNSNQLNIKHRVDVSTLSSGYYILSVSDGKQALNDKFMIAK